MFPNSLVIQVLEDSHPLLSQISQDHLFVLSSTPCQAPPSRYAWRKAPKRGRRRPRQRVGLVFHLRVLRTTLEKRRSWAG